MRALVLAALLAAPVLARAQSADCSVAAASVNLAAAYGLDPAPFRVLAARACGEAAPRARVSTYRVGREETGISNVPSDTEALVAADSRITQLMNLPHGLKALNVARTGVWAILNLPDSLEFLDLSGTKVTQLLNLPHGLRYLDLRDTAVTSLLNLPSSVECVVSDRVTGRNVVRSPRECGLSDEWMRFMSR